MSEVMCWMHISIIWLTKKNMRININHKINNRVQFQEKLPVVAGVKEQLWAVSSPLKEAVPPQNQ